VRLVGERIPRFESTDEEADFWDKTALEDLAPGQVQPAEVERPESAVSTTFAVRLRPATVALLKEVAKAHNLGVTQLVRSWILDRLRVEQKAGVLAELKYPLAGDFEIVIRKKAVESVMGEVGNVAERVISEIARRFESEVELTRDGLLSQAQ
jgi:hypothetical protein